MSVNHYATRNGLPTRLVDAIIEVESDGNPYAARHEPHYRWLWDVSKGLPYRATDTPDQFPSILPASSHTEYHLQKTSLGLMQIMGATARQMGFHGPFLTALCDADTGVEYGCKYLAHLNRRFGGRGLDAVVAAYNAGTPRRYAGVFVNQDYVDAVRDAGGLP